MEVIKMGLSAFRGWYSDPELDSEGDQIGVILQKEVICGYCLTPMEQVSERSYSCPHCHFICRV